MGLIGATNPNWSQFSGSSQLRFVNKLSVVWYLDNILGYGHPWSRKWIHFALLLRLITVLRTAIVRLSDFIQTNIFLNLILKDFISDWFKVSWIKENCSNIDTESQRNISSDASYSMSRWRPGRRQEGMFNILHSDRLLFHRCKLSSWQNSEDVRQTFLANTYQASRYNKWLPVSLLKNKAGYLIDASIGFSSYCNVVRVYTGWPSKGIFRIILNDLKLKNGRNIKFNFSQLKSLMVTEWLNGSQLPEMHPHLQIMEERIRLQNVQSICWNKIFSIIMQAVIRAGSVLVTLMVMVSWLWCLSI